MDNAALNHWDVAVTESVSHNVTSLQLGKMFLYESNSHDNIKSLKRIRRVPEVGSKVLQRRPRRRCAGLVSMPSLGVLRQSRRAWNSLTPAARHFVNRRLTVRTAFSALPLLCGYLGLEVICWKFHWSMNFANSEEAKHGPLSVTSESGTPNRLKVAIRLLIADLEVSDERESTSMKLLK